MNSIPSQRVSQVPSRPAFPARGFLSATLFLGLLAIGLPVVGHAQTNSWTNSGSGLWATDGSWLLGTAPADNPVVYITNAGSKTVTVDAATPGGNLRVTNLTISAASGAINTLYLGGNATPLGVLGTLSLGANSSLVLDNGQLVTTNNAAAIGQSGVGLVTVSNGAWLAQTVNLGPNSGSRGVLNVFGGTNTFANLSVGYGSSTATGSVLLASGALIVTNGTTWVGDAGAGEMTVSNGTFVTKYLTVGNAATGRGVLTLAGGSNVVTHTGTSFILGGTAGSTGTVLMTGGQLDTTAGTAANIGSAGVGVMTVSNGIWRASTVNVGLNARSSGSLTIAGGTNFLNTLSVGGSSSATGAVLLTGGQLLATNAAATARINVGDSGVGTLTVSNGTLLSQYLYVGNIAGSSGTLALDGGTSVVTRAGSSFFVGYNANSTGKVVLAGGQLDTRNVSAYVGYSGIGSMIASGGTWLATTIYAGYSGGSSGALNFSSGTNVLSFANLYLGNAANSTGTLAITGGQLVTTNGIVNLGTLGVGSITASGGTWLAKDVYAGTSSGAPPSLLNLSGGTNIMNLVVGVNAGSTGTVILSGGQLVTSNSATTYVGFNGAGTMTVSGGTWLAQNVYAGYAAGVADTLAIAGGTNVFSGLTIGNSVGSTGMVRMSGGNLFITNAGGTALLQVGPAGVGTLVMSNGTVTVDHLVASNGASSAFSMVGGTLNTRATLISNAANLVVGDGVGVAAMNLMGGTHSFADGLTVNTNATLLSLAANSAFGSSGLRILSGGLLQVSNGNSTVGGVVSNSGTINVVNSRVTYTAPVVIGGLYRSDPSTNTFASNLTVTASGTLQGSNGDLFVFQKDFVLQSTNRMGFNLADASVIFTNATVAGTNHILNLAGSTALDLGSNWISHTSLATNFAIGQLSVAAGNRLTLTGEKGVNALYVGWLDLSAWNTNASLLTNTLLSALILPDINLYYDKFDSNNAYLMGQVYDFSEWGAGHGLLIPIPEPSTMLAVGSGLVLLAFLRRRV